ncbi:hypothetical protein C8C77_10510 [Halanaerobium saccharolyticum]|uniref:t-SNARE coiled-coil homology domain-containing protein n=1 Tax=Halanaerobium saccharolyticum TaxID=43595 RepID=A0A4R7Z5A1_9FIRM|nr:hypothetical protein [Halanaerobium saccharolyticum]RAK12448.1 hypothetical protein C7958_10110 [Halanaerobium saccharolyticum]TDW06374.1 hypothetical protein C8C77_10510 [Halanaerobium saccharolyticum]TDX61622.1 hypothetical protein C7956_10510 [Halanaerobium saccharolyticum]
MAEDKTLNLILSKIEDLDSKFDKLDSKFDKLNSRVDKLDSKVDKLDSKVAALDSRVDGLEVNLSNFRGEFNSFRNETNETLARIEKRVDATFDQVGGLSEYKTRTEAQLENIESDMSYYARKQIENEKEIYKLENKLAK